MKDSVYLEALREVDELTPGSPRLAVVADLFPAKPEEASKGWPYSRPNGSTWFDHMAQEYVWPDGRRLARERWFLENHVVFR